MIFARSEAKNQVALDTLGTTNISASRDPHMVSVHGGIERTSKVRGHLVSRSLLLVSGDIPERDQDFSDSMSTYLQTFLWPIVRISYDVCSCCIILPLIFPSYSASILGMSLLTQVYFQRPKKCADSWCTRAKTRSSSRSSSSNLSIQS